MFKFKSIYTESGSFTFNSANYLFTNGVYETEEQKIAEFLRNNPNFAEIKQQPLKVTILNISQKVEEKIEQPVQEIKEVEEVKEVEEIEKELIEEKIEIRKPKKKRRG